MASTKTTKGTSAKNQNSSYAIVETSGSQFWLETNRYYDLDRIKAEVDQKVTLKNVLLIKNDKEIKLGKPYIKGASVTLKVMGHRRGAKILVYKMRPKKKTRRKNGHRQELTRVMVEAISSGAKPKEQSLDKESTSKTKEPKNSTKKVSKASKT